MSANQPYEHEPTPSGYEYMQPEKPTSKKKKMAIGGIVFAVVAAVAYLGVNWYTSKDAPSPEANSVETVEAPQASITDEPALKQDVPNATEMKELRADRPRLRLSYPSTWTVTEESAGIRLESPKFTYATTTGQETSGNFRIYIRQGAREQDSKYIGRGVAALPSEKLTYTEPAPYQRPETNLSFFGLDSADHFSFFFIAGNYSLKKGDTLGPDYGKEPQTFIIAGGYSSSELAEDMAMNPVSLETFDKSNAYEQAIDIIKSLQLL